MMLLSLIKIHSPYRSSEVQDRALDCYPLASTATSAFCADIKQWMSLIIHKVSSETFAFRTDPHVLHPEIVNKYQAVDDHDLFADDHGLFRDICSPCRHRTVDELDHPHVLHHEFVNKYNSFIRFE